MRYALPLALTAVVLTVTYFTCLRPMRRSACQQGAGSTEVDPQLQQLREEVKLLRHEAELRRQAPLVPDADGQMGSLSGGQKLRRQFPSGASQSHDP